MRETHELHKYHLHENKSGVCGSPLPHLCWWDFFCGHHMQVSMRKNIEQLSNTFKPIITSVYRRNVFFKPVYYTSPHTQFWEPRKHVLFITTNTYRALTNNWRKFLSSACVLPSLPRTERHPCTELQQNILMKYDTGKAGQGSPTYDESEH